MDSYSKLEAICKKQHVHPIRIVNLQDKDYGICRMNIKQDFEIIIYDLELQKRAGHAEFNFSWTGLFKEFYNIDISDKKAYNEGFKITRKYQGLGLSKVLLEESINVLTEKHKPHIVQFATAKGVERLKQQFLDRGYNITIPNKKDYPLVMYKKY